MNLRQTFLLVFGSLLIGVPSEVAVGQTARKGSESFVDRPFPWGISAWEYGTDVDGVIEDIHAYDVLATRKRQFRYLFPYTGSVWIGPGGPSSFEVWYSDSPTTCAYARELPDCMMLVNVDGDNVDGLFDDWTDTEYERAAQLVADAVIADPCAAGVVMDIEPYHPSHIPFYRHLRNVLAADGRVTGLFVGWGGASTQLFEAVDLVVISGYDINGSPSDPAVYGSQMDTWIGILDRRAEAADGWFMMGIPASASWGEWEYKGGDRCPGERSGHAMEDYVAAATAALWNHADAKRMVGTALWVMGMSDNDKCTDCCRYPRTIRPAVWDLLRRY